MFDIGDKIIYSYISILPSGNKIKHELEGRITGFCPDNEDMVCVELDVRNGTMSYKVDFNTLTKLSNLS